MIFSYTGTHTARILHRVQFSFSEYLIVLYCVCSSVHSQNYNCAQMPQYMQIHVKINESVCLFIFLFKITDVRMSCHNKNYESYEV